MCKLCQDSGLADTVIQQNHSKRRIKDQQKPYLKILDTGLLWLSLSILAKAVAFERTDSGAAGVAVDEAPRVFGSARLAN